MATHSKKILSLVLALVLCLGMFSTVALADKWQGGKVLPTVPEEAAGEGYEFLSVYKNPAHAYEMSGHMVSTDGGVHNSIPQTLMMVFADSAAALDGVYGEGANYEVLYCCDAETGYEDGCYYKRMNLEDSTYYTAEDAAKIRAIVSISYPFVSIEEMKTSLRLAGYPYADQLTRAEIISGVQAAIWYFANKEEYVYSQSFDVATNAQWGTVMHEYGWEGYAAPLITGKRKFATDDDIATRINALIACLKGLPGVEAKDGQVVITKLEIVDTEPAKTVAGSYKVTLNVELNHAPSSQDNVDLTIKVNGVKVKTVDVEAGAKVFPVEIIAENNTTIEAVLSGTQILKTGVYFYEPEGGRDVSQSLVGIAKGETAIYAEASVELSVKEPEDPKFRFPKGGASNVSYMLINEETRKVTFVKKVDLQDGQTSLDIITKEGYIPAMFIKQSTSGKFWIGCDVEDKAIEEAVIKCLKANNKSYKGHDEEFAYGYGTHILEYKKGKKVHQIPYTFGE